MHAVCKCVHFYICNDFLVSRVFQRHVHVIVNLVFQRNGDSVNPVLQRNGDVVRDYVVIIVATATGIKNMAARPELT